MPTGWYSAAIGAGLEHEIKKKKYAHKIIYFTTQAYIGRHFTFPVQVT
jgi:hypothetical protein